MRQAQSKKYLLACLKLPLLHELALHSDSLHKALKDQLIKRCAEFQEIRESSIVDKDGDTYLEVAAISDDANENYQSMTSIITRLSEPYRLDSGSWEEIADHEAEMIVSVFCGFTLTRKLHSNDFVNARMAAVKARKMPVCHGGVVVMYDPSLRATYEQSFAQKQIVLTSIGQGTLEVHYQPKICLLTDKIKGFEALIRPPKNPIEPWSSQAGQIGALEVVMAVESLNLMAELTVHVLLTVIKDMREWDTLYPNIAPTVSINAPPKTLIQGWDLISNTLDEVPDPTRITIEITEHDLEDADTNNLNRVINSLRDRGFGVAIDDFGMGHSNLTRLSGLPFTEVKLDRALTQNLNMNPMSHELVRQLVTISKQQNLKIIAEGIETGEEKEIVKTLGVPVGQGFLFGKPECASKTAKRLGIHYAKHGVPNIEPINTATFIQETNNERKQPNVTVRS